MTIKTSQDFKKNASTKILVVGVFRSCTNLMKHMIDEYLVANCVFNEWLWKHGLPPTLPEVSAIIPPEIPIVVMGVDPYKWHQSLFQFWLRRRPELISADCQISDFIVDNIFIYDNTRYHSSPKYIFNSPSDYWNQYYYSWLNWQAIKSQVIFINSQRLVEAPSKVMSILSQRYEIPFVESQRSIILPKLKLGPTVKPLSDPSRKILDDTDRSNIRHRISPMVYNQLRFRYKSF